MVMFKPDHFDCLYSLIHNSAIHEKTILSISYKFAICSIGEISILNLNSTLKHAMVFCVVLQQFLLKLFLLFLNLLFAVFVFLNF